MELHSLHWCLQACPCAGEQPRVKLIPGSAEQRGTDIVRALRGEVPFCRCDPRAEWRLAPLTGAVPSNVSCVFETASHKPLR